MLFSSINAFGPATVQVVKAATEEELQSLGVRSWPTWGCEASKFPWTYGQSETCFLLKGQVTVTPDGGEAVSFGSGIQTYLETCAAVGARRLIVFVQRLWRGAAANTSQPYFSNRA